MRKTDLQIWQLQHRQIAENVFAKSRDYLELDALIRYNIVILEEMFIQRSLTTPAELDIF